MNNGDLLISRYERKARLKDIFYDTLLLLEKDKQLAVDTEKALKKIKKVNNIFTKIYLKFLIF